MDCMNKTYFLRKLNKPALEEQMELFSLTSGYLRSSNYKYFTTIFEETTEVLSIFKCHKEYWK